MLGEPSWRGRKGCWSKDGKGEEKGVGRRMKGEPRDCGIEAMENGRGLGIRLRY